MIGGLYKRTFADGTDIIVEVLSVTLSHVYLRNIKTKYRYNILKSSFDEKYNIEKEM